MVDRRHKDGKWQAGDSDGVVPTWERAQLAVLMDLRDELKKLNRVLECPNFLAIPSYLRSINRKTARIPAKKKKKATA
jgi:hypothetical protein